MNWDQILGGEILPTLGLNPVAAFGVHLVMALIMGQALAWHYMRYAHVLSNKRKFARMFVFLTVTSFLMISCVKQSAALSLGLIGALSIVRFRTPIKEPEELAYLFLAIAIGVGLAANQLIPVAAVFTVLLVYLAVRGTGSAASPALRTILQVSAPLRDPDADASGAAELKTLMPAVEHPCSKVDLRRVDCHDGEFHASLIVELNTVDQIAEVMNGVQTALPGATVSVIERDGFE